MKIFVIQYASLHFLKRGQVLLRLTSTLLTPLIAEQVAQRSPTVEAASTRLYSWSGAGEFMEP